MCVGSHNGGTEYKGESSASEEVEELRIISNRRIQTLGATVERIAFLITPKIYKHIEDKHF